MKKRVALEVVLFLLIATTFIEGYFELDSMPPSALPPAGLEIRETPQFIVIGSDDNTLVEGLRWYADLIQSRSNPTTKSPNSQTFDGAPLNGSFYVIGDSLENDTVAEIFKNLYNNGFDIGNHSQSHVGSVEIDDYTVLLHRTVEEYTEEVVACNNQLIEKVGMNPSDIKGFRTPMLKYSDTVLTVLGQQNFLYDCSLISGHESWEGIGKMGTYFWPYTLENGSPSCTYDNYYTKTYDLPIGLHEGLWEIPCHLYDIIPDSLCEQYSIEPGLKSRIDNALGYTTIWKVEGVDFNLWAQYKLTSQECLAILKYALDLSYAGNRAPFHYLIHSDFYSETELYTEWFPSVTRDERRYILEQFIDYALQKKDVRFISSAQLIDWMRNPTPLKNSESSISNEAVLKNAISIRNCANNVLQLYTPIKGEYCVQITTLQGRVILNENRQFNIGVNTIALADYPLAKSVYLLSLTSPKGLNYSAKISIR